MNKKQRVDNLLVEKQLVETREKAKRLIMAGLVFLNNERVDKPGTKIDVKSKLEVRGKINRYVSRGGLKLEKALEQFKICLQNKIAIDVGASTGGFTDCILQKGAKKVYAIDVGYGQLAWKLRQNEKVIVIEKTNVRYIKPDIITELVDLVTIDVSFISLTLILPAIIKLLKDKADIICLIKPQFEAGKDKVGKKGVIKDKDTHIEVISNIIDFSINIGLNPIDLSFSPIKGPEGNIEYLLHLKYIKDCKGTLTANVDDEFIKKLVLESHNDLNNELRGI